MHKAKTGTSGLRKRYLGGDLHRDSFWVCVRESRQEPFSRWSRPPLADVQRRVLLGQIEAQEASIAELEQALREAAPRWPGSRNWLRLPVLGSRSAAILLAEIGDVQDFADPGKRAAYFGMGPCVEQSNHSQHHGRITRRGNKLARTTLLPCARVAKRGTPFLHRF